MFNSFSEMDNPNPESLSSMNINELKRSLKLRGLAVSGRKAILIERLKEHLLKEQAAKEQRQAVEEKEQAAKETAKKLGLMDTTSDSKKRNCHDVNNSKLEIEENAKRQKQLPALDTNSFEYTKQLIDQGLSNVESFVRTIETEEKLITSKSMEASLIVKKASNAAKNAVDEMEQQRILHIALQVTEGHKMLAAQKTDAENLLESLRALKSESNGLSSEQKQKIRTSIEFLNCEIKGVVQPLAVKSNANIIGSQNCDNIVNNIRSSVLNLVPQCKVLMYRPPKPILNATSVTENQIRMNIELPAETKHEFTVNEIRVFYKKKGEDETQWTNVAGRHSTSWDIRGRVDFSRNGASFGGRYSYNKINASAYIQNCPENTSFEFRAQIIDRQHIESAWSRVYTFTTSTKPYKFTPINAADLSAIGLPTSAGKTMWYVSMRPDPNLVSAQHAIVDVTIKQGMKITIRFYTRELSGITFLKYPGTYSNGIFYPKINQYRDELIVIKHKPNDKSFNRGLGFDKINEERYEIRGDFEVCFNSQHGTIIMKDVKKDKIFRMIEEVSISDWPCCFGVLVEQGQSVCITDVQYD